MSEYELHHNDLDSFPPDLQVVFGLVAVEAKIFKLFASDDQNFKNVDDE